MDKKYYLVIVLMILEIVSLTLMYKSVQNKNVVLDEVKLINETNSNMLSIMTDETGNGTYTEYPGTSWPSSNNNYFLNTTKTKCMNEKGDTISANNISFSNDKIEIHDTSQGTHCTLYFDVNLGTLTFTFADGASEAISGTFGWSASWTMKGATKYCYTKESTSANCGWSSFPTGITNSYGAGPVSADLGTYTIYFYIQDAAGHVKGASDSIKIVAPDYPPLISKFDTTSVLSTSIAVEVNASDDKGISKYCYSYKLTSAQNFTTEECNENSNQTDTYTFEGLQPNTTYVLKVTVYDNNNQTATQQINEIKTSEGIKPVCTFAVKDGSVSLVTDASSWYFTRTKTDSPTYGHGDKTIYFTLLYSRYFYGYVKSADGTTSSCQLDISEGIPTKCTATMKTISGKCTVTGTSQGGQICTTQIFDGSKNCSVIDTYTTPRCTGVNTQCRTTGGYFYNCSCNTIPTTYNCSDGRTYASSSECTSKDCKGTIYVCSDGKTYSTEEECTNTLCYNNVCLSSYDSLVLTDKVYCYKQIV